MDNDSRYPLALEHIVNSIKENLTHLVDNVHEVFDEYDLPNLVMTVYVTSYNKDYHTHLYGGFNNTMLFPRDYMNRTHQLRNATVLCSGYDCNELLVYGTHVEERLMEDGIYANVELHIERLVSSRMDQLGITHQIVNVPTYKITFPFNQFRRK